MNNIVKIPKLNTYYLLIALVFVLSLGIFNPIYATITICLFIIVLLCLLSNRNFGIPSSNTFIFLSLFGISYISFGQLSLSYVAFYLVAPLLSYTAGYYCSSIVKGNIEITTKTFIYTIIYAETSHALLNFILNYRTARWELVDVFRGLRSATGSAFINTFILSLAFVFLFIEKNHKLICIGTICLIISLAYSFVLGTRTTFVVAVIVFVINATMFFHEKLAVKQFIRFLSVFLLFISSASVLYLKDVFGIKTYLETSNLFIRFSEIGLEQSDRFRFESLYNGFLSLLDHPLGGQISHDYFHNMWLDVGRVGGLLPFIFLVTYSVISLAHVIRLFANKTISQLYRHMVLSIYLGILINCFTEPVMEGVMDSFLLFLFINGLVERDYRRLIIIDTNH